MLDNHLKTERAACSHAQPPHCDTCGPKGSPAPGQSFCNLQPEQMWLSGHLSISAQVIKVSFDSDIAAHEKLHSAEHQLPAHSATRVVVRSALAIDLSNTPLWITTAFSECLCTMSTATHTPQPTALDRQLQREHTAAHWALANGCGHLKLRLEITY